MKPLALVVVPTSVSVPIVDEPTRAVLAKKLVDDAVVAKNAVDVALVITLFVNERPAVLTLPRYDPLTRK